MPSVPALFNDSLAARAAPVRYRRVGNPYSFLNSIGIDAILEQIYQAHNLVDVAKELNISVTILLTWLDNEGHMQRIEDATRFSAEGYLSEAASLLRQANTDFELKKAKEIASHGRFMASKLDKVKYGGDQQKLGNATGVTFIMHMGDKSAQMQVVMAQEELPMPAEARFIRGDYSVLEHDPLIAQPDGIGPFEPVPFEPVQQDVPEHLKPLNMRDEA